MTTDTTTQQIIAYGYDKNNDNDTYNADSNTSPTGQEEEQEHSATVVS